MQFGAGIQKMVEVSLSVLEKNQSCGYTEAAEGLGVDTEL